ncbi:MAG: ABC transporter substrate-binding protein [Silvanigrellaceae bacterium]
MFLRIARLIAVVLLFVCASGVGAAFADAKNSGKLRIVSLSPATTEWVDAFGLADSLVGVTEQCDFPPRVGVVSKVGSFMRTSIERVLLNKPTDVVTVDGLPSTLRGQLVANGVRVHVFAVQRLADFPAQILSLGEALGAAEQGKIWADRFKSVMVESWPTVNASGKAASRTSRISPVVKSFLIFVALQPPYVAAPESWLSELFERHGHRNGMRELPSISQGKSSFVQMSLEAVFKTKSDLWVTFSERAADNESIRKRAATLMSRGRIEKPPRIEILSADLFHRPGPRLLEAFQQVGRLYQ